MRRAQKLAAGIAAAMMASAVSAPVSFAADNAFGIDEMNWTDQDWNCIAMTNDDTVETGAVIRTQADQDSKAAGYLYRGAAVQVVEKGEEWSEVRSGKVTGYVKNEFLAFGDDARGLAAHYGTQGIIANWNDVNVFSEDDADSEIKTQLSDGAPMSMLEDNGHWIAVQHGADSAGFVSEDDVTRVLLVDTAVPAEGEDVADIPATMTAADVPGRADAGQASDASSGGDGAQEDYTLAAAAYEDAASYSEDTSSYGEEGYSYSEDGTSYSEDTSSYGEESYSYADDSYSEDTSSYSDTSYSEDTSSYSDTSYSEDGYSYSEDTSSYDDTQSSSALSTQPVSDNPEIQALYDAYINAQNAAMDCTSEEDALAKAEAATNAWNAYLAACGDSSAASSQTDDGSYGTETASYTDDSGQTYQEEAVYTEEQATQAETSSQAESTSSSGSNAYGYSDLDLLAAIIWCEAGNQSYDGMVAVGQVVMNRVASPSFPNSIPEVLNQPGQFTPASAGTLQAALASGVNSTCYSAAKDAMSGAAPVPGYPMYFNTHSGSYQLGAHYFS